MQPGEEYILERQEMIELAEIISNSVVSALRDSGLVGKTPTAAPKKEKTAYQKCEQLLFNYNGFKRIVEERKQEIADLRKYGVPGKSPMSGGERVQTSRSNVGIVLPEDAVEDAVRTVERSVQETIRVIGLIDKCMATLRNDMYYDIIPMRYFEGRTLEDIGIFFGVDHTTISRNKSRLVKELAMRLFPDEVAKEMMQ